MKYVTAVFMPRLLSIIVLLLAATPAAAQVGEAVQVRDMRAGPEAERAPSPFVISPGLYTPEGRALARQFQAARATGLLPRSAKTSGTTFNLGDMQVFHTQQFPAYTWRETDFTLKAQDDGYRLWVATEELDNGHVTDADVEALVEALTARTPDSSIDPDQGILANNTALFGDVPNVDGDGVLDILWYDIRDLYPSAAGPIVLGYIAPEDYAPDAPQGMGNGADILYLDTNPLLTGNVGEITGNPLVIVEEYGIEAVAQVAAQVHQQLIHFNLDADESGFVEQGLGTWAALLNGYDTCGDGYLQDPTEHFTIPLLYWDRVSQAMQDIQRSALLTTYFTEQVGQDAGIALMNAGENGADGFRAVLAAQGETRTLEELVLDFHTANYVADTSVDPRFGYLNPACQDVQAPPTEQVDASLGSFITPFSVQLQGGGVVYLLIENVRNLEVSLNIPDAAQQDHIHFRVVRERLDGSIDVQELATGMNQITGNFASLTLIAFYDELSDFNAQGTFEMAAEWENTAVFTENIAYEDGTIALQQPSFNFAPEASIQATRFEVPPGSHLAKIFVAPYYESQFAEATSNIRDLTVHVWADDGSGLPGEELLALPVNDPRSPGQVDRDLDTILFFAIDVQDRAEVETEAEAIHIGLSNAGDDDNYLVLAMALSDATSPSSWFVEIQGNEAWYPFTALNLGENMSLSDRVIPIRAQFRNEAVRTDIVEPAEVPTAVTLAQNYPNPFNPNTMIRYEVPEATNVRLAVYDVLGRQVGVLVDGRQAGGTYEVSLDASGWASGIYFYTLETERQNLMRRMLLIK